MTYILKLGRQRVILCKSPKIRTEIYHHISRHEVTLIAGIRPFQAGFTLRMPPWLSSFVLRIKWSDLGMTISDFADSCRWRLRDMRERFYGATTFQPWKCALLALERAMQRR